LGKQGVLVKLEKWGFENRARWGLGMTIEGWRNQFVATLEAGWSLAGLEVHMLKAVESVCPVHCLLSCHSHF
jgi:hypothetical protein